MLTDLARNDVNRVCDPMSTRVDRLMVCSVAIGAYAYLIYVVDNPTLLARSTHDFRSFWSAEAGKVEI